MTLTFGDGAFQFAMTDDESVAAELYPAGEGHAERRSLRTGALVSEEEVEAPARSSCRRRCRVTATMWPCRTSAIPARCPSSATDRHAGGEGATPDLIGYAAGSNDPLPALSPDAGWSAYAENDVISVARTQQPGPEPFQVTQLRGIARTGVNSLRFVSNRFLLSGSDNRLMVWDLSQNTPLMTGVDAKLPGVPTYAISRQLVSNGPGTFAVIINPAAGFTIVDVQTGAVLTGTDSSSFLAWRSDTELYYADSADRMVRLYDVADGRSSRAGHSTGPTGPTATTSTSGRRDMCRAPIS